MKKTVPSLTKFEHRSREWLLDIQDDSGGWAEHPGSRPSTLNTAEVLLALVSSGIAAGDSKIQKAIVLLENDRVAHAAPEPDTGAWCRTVGDGTVRLVPDLVRTSVIVRALISGGRPVTHPIVKEALEWIVGRQNTAAKDRGWGFRRGDPSQLFPTCFALVTLMRTSDAAGDNAWRDQVVAGLDQLGRFHKSDGSFGDGNLKTAHTLLAVLVLQAARQCGFPTVADMETDALHWLLDNPSEALAPIEESIRIDTVEGGGGDYGYTFTMHALLLQAIAGSRIDKHRESALWIETQRRLVELQDEQTGAFFGSRVFSWSTAAALYSIRHANKFLSDIPVRRGEDPTGTKIGNVVGGVVILLILAVVFLAARRQFSMLEAGIFAFLMLSCLVAYKAIGETTFGQLSTALLKSVRGTDSAQPAKND